MKKEILDLVKMYPYKEMSTSVLDTISIGDCELSNLANKDYDTSSLLYERFLEFYYKHKDKMDKNKFMAYMAYILNKTEKLKSYPFINDSDDIQIAKLKINVNRINEIVRKSPNVRIYLLENINGRFEITDFETYDILGKERDTELPKRFKKYENQIKDDKFLKKLVDLIDYEDLKNFIPIDLLKMIKEKEKNNLYLAYFKGKSDSDRIEYMESHEEELDKASNASICEDILKFRNRIDIEQFMLIAAYRGMEFINSLLDEKSKKQNPDNVKRLTDVYNSMVDISNILGKSNNIKIKGKIADLTATDGSYKSISYSAKHLARDVKALNEKVKPSKFTLKSDPLESEEEGDISLKGLFEKVGFDDEIVSDEDKIRLQKDEPLGPYRINFNSPECKESILKSSDKPPIVYRGTKGKAFEGYAVYIYQDLKFSVLECFYKKNQEGDERYSYGDASSVIVPIEMLEKVLKSKTILENIPLQKEYRAPKAINEGEKVIYTTNLQSLKRKKYIRKEEYRRPVRITHKKNWNVIMEGIIKGKINPFEAIIVKKVSRKKDINQKSAIAKDKKEIRSVED